MNPKFTSQLLALFVIVTVSARADDWPQWRGPTADGVWAETGIVEKFASPTLTRKWTAHIGAGYSGPTVAAGRVYVTDRLTSPAETERVLCFQEATGELAWKYEYPCRYGKIGYQAGPRAAVVIHDGLAYALGATGWLHCLDAVSGKVVWKIEGENAYHIEMPIWGISGSPVIVKDLVIVHLSGEKACIVAFDRKTGEERWKALADRGQYTTPVVVKQANQLVVICWTGDSVAGLSADKGEVLWRYVWRPRNMPIGCATPVVSGDKVFCTSFYDGSLLLKLGTDSATAEKIWQIAGRSERETDALHSIISTPLFDGKHVYGVDSYGELRCLDANDGKRLWEDLRATPKARWSTIHFVRNGERQFLFNERGELIIAQLSPQGYTEISRAKLLDPTLEQLRQRDGVCWSHPAYANRCIYARNDKELVAASLAR